MQGAETSNLRRLTPKTEDESAFTKSMLRRTCLPALYSLHEKGADIAEKPMDWASNHFSFAEYSFATSAKSCADGRRSDDP